MSASPSLAVATRLDVVTPDASAGRRSLERRVRLRKLRRMAATAAWLLFMLIVAAIVLLGGRPTPL